MRTTLPAFKVDVIYTSDWHLRESTPVCRTDDFWEAQWKKVSFVAELQKKYQCPVIHAGDLFHHWKPSPYLLSKTIQRLPKNFATIYGQHDLPQHNLELAQKSGIHTLVEAGAMRLLVGGVHYGLEPCSVVTWDGKAVLVWHKLVWTGSPPWPGCEEPTARTVLRKYKQYDLIVTGDNHQPFVVEMDRRLLVNPGSLTRQTADQVDHTPRVYLWSAETNTVKPVYVPISEGVISREHLERQARRDERIEAFVSKLDTSWVADVSFESNLERFQKENNISFQVMEIVHKAMEQE